MRNNGDGLEIDRIVIIAALLLIGLLALAAGDGKQSPANISGSYNTHYETHTTTTNIDICGICVELPQYSKEGD